MGEPENALSYFQRCFYYLIPQFHDIKDENGNPTISSITVILNDINLLEVFNQKAIALSKFPNSDSLRKSLMTYKEAIQLIDRVRLGFQDKKTKISFAKLAKKIFEGAIVVSLELGMKGDAFSFTEKSKNFTLLEGMRTYKALKYGGVPDSLVKREVNLKSEIARLEKDFFQVNDDDIFEKLRLLKEEQESLLDTLKTNFERYYNLKYDVSVLTLTDIQQNLLDDNQTMIEYFIGEDKSYAFVLKKGEEIKVISLPISTDTLRNWVNTFVNAIYVPYIKSDDLKIKKLQEHYNPTRSRELYSKLGFELYEVLISPIKKKFPEFLTERIVIIPDDI